MTTMDRDPAHLHPAFWVRLETVLAELAATGWRPKIVETARSAERQLDAHTTGHSLVRLSLHQYQLADGTPAALACDIIDARYGWGAGAAEFFLSLRDLAIAHGLVSGHDWTHLPDAAHVQAIPVTSQGAVWSGADPVTLMLPEPP